jgi:hypothetical protein
VIMIVFSTRCEAEPEDTVEHDCVLCSVWAEPEDTCDHDCVLYEVRG